MRGHQCCPTGGQHRCPFNSRRSCLCPRLGRFALVLGTLESPQGHSAAGLALDKQPQPSPCCEASTRPTEKASPKERTALCAGRNTAHSSASGALSVAGREHSTRTVLAVQLQTLSVRACASNPIGPVHPDTHDPFEGRGFRVTGDEAGVSGSRGTALRE